MDRGSIEKQLVDKAIADAQEASQYRIFRHPITAAGQDGYRYFTAKTLGEARRVHRQAIGASQSEAYALAVRALRGGL